jgi:hypothetical protein
MKKVLLYLLFSFSFLSTFAQTEKAIYGKISSLGTNLKNVDVINITSKKVVTTNELGDFIINAKVNEELFIISKDYIDQKIILTPLLFEKNNLVITLEKKPIELDEVKIVTAPEIKLKVGYNELNAAKLEKQQTRPTNSSVYTGEIVNGMDFVQIGKMLFGLFKKKKKQTYEEKTAVKDFIKNNFSDDFFLKNLNLKPFEIERFIEYCQNDSNYKKTIATGDLFLITDFLISKKESYK